MATITTILATDIIAASRVTINTNFANLNADKVDVNSTYVDPAWLTSLAGSKVTGNISGNAATATALATARTIAGVSFNGTANIAIPSTGLSDSSDIVRGAASVASGQVLYGTGAGAAGSEANLFWDAANGRLGVGTNAPNNPLQVVSTATSAHSIFVSAPATNSAGPGVGFASNNGANTGLLQLDNSGNLVLRQAQSSMFFDFASQLNFRANAGVTQLMRLLSNGNLLLGTTTDDGTNRLQVAGSARLATTANGTPVALALLATGTGSDATVDTVGSGAYMYLRSTLASPYAGTQINKTTNTVLWFTGTQGLDTYGWFTGSSFTRLASLTTGGTFSLYNETPTTGSTSLVVRAGAGQGSNNLTTWQNSGGTQVAAVTSAGDIYSLTLATTGNQAALTTNGIEVRSAAVAAWSSTTSWAGTKDLSLSRAGVNIGQFGDGGSNSNGLLYLKGVRPVGSTVANLPAAAGNTGMMATVTDANATTIGTTVAGGGANTVLVWSNGTNWRIYAN